MRGVAFGLYGVWLLAMGKQIWSATPAISLGDFYLSLRELTPFCVSCLLPALGRLSGLVAASGLCIFMLAALGDHVARWLGIGIENSRMRRVATVVSLGCGWLMVTSVIQALGHCGLLFRSLFIVSLILAGAVVAISWRRNQTLGLLKFFREAATLRLACLAILCSLLAATLLAAIPLISTDVRTYHLGAPEGYLKAHKSFSHLWEPYWHVGLATEMVYLPSYALGGLYAAKFVNVALLASLVLATAALGGCFLSPAASWWGAAIMASCGFIHTTVLNGKTDMGTVMAVTMAVPCILQGLTTRRPAWWLAGGILAGYGFSAKYTAGFALVGMIIATGVAGPLGRTFLKRIALFVLGATLVSGPWLLQNVFWSGNPIFPFFSRILGGLLSGPELEQAISRPWKVLMGVEDWSPQAILTNAFTFGIPIFGTLAVGLLLPLGIARTERVQVICVRWCKWFFFVTYIGLLLHNQVSRYLWLLFPLACVFSVRALDHGSLSLQRRALQLIVLALVVCNLALVAAKQVSLLPKTWLGVLLGQHSSKSFQLSCNPPAELARRWLNHSLARRDKVFSAYEQRFLSLIPSQFCSSSWTPPPPWWWARETFTVADLRKKFKQHGITHVVHNVIRARFAVMAWYPGPPWSDRALNLYRSFGEQYLTLLYRPERYNFEGGAFYVWRIERHPKRPQRPLLALPCTEGIFSEVHRTPVQHQEGGLAPALDQVQFTASRLTGVLDAKNWVAIELYRVGRFAEAISLFEQERRAGYLNHVSLLLHARALRQLGREQQAQAIFQEVYKLTQNRSTLKEMSRVSRL